MACKFEHLEVWQMALEYSDFIYALIELLPRSEDKNLKDQLRRAVTSIGLNIAEGSTTTSDAEQARYLGHAIRSVLETVAAQHYIHRRGYLRDKTPLREAYNSSEKLFAKLQAFRNRLTGHTAREEAETYLYDSPNPFDH